jgi:hypothetical protein
MVEQISSRVESDEDEVSFLSNKPRLTFKGLSGKHKGAQPQLKVKADEDEKEFKIGRDPLSSLVIEDQPSVSRSHAMISYDDEENWMVRDLGSTSGTYIAIGNNRWYS